MLISDQDLKSAIAKGQLDAYWTGRYTVIQRASQSDNYADRSSWNPAGGTSLNADAAWVLVSSVAEGETVLSWGSEGITRLLATLVGPHGRVYAMAQSLGGFQSTEKALREASLRERVILHWPPPEVADQARLAPAECLPARASVAWIEGKGRWNEAKTALDWLPPHGLLLIHDFLGARMLPAPNGDILPTGTAGLQHAGANTQRPSGRSGCV